MAKVTAILTNKDYGQAMARMNAIFHAEMGTPEGDERDALFDLIEAYEDKRYDMVLPSLPEALKSYMEEHGLTTDDLAQLVGDQQKASAVLSGRMDITMPMARALHQRWRISSAILLQDPTIASERETAVSIRS